MKTWIVLGTTTVAAIALFLSFIGQLGRWNLYFELASHFRVQYFIIGLITILASLFYRAALPFVLSAVCIILNLTAIAPWYFPASGQAFDIQSETNPTPLKIMVANVNTHNHNYSALSSLVRQERPDILAVIEVDQAWLDALQAVKDILPYSVQAPGSGFGIALYSALPLQDQAVQDWGRPSLSATIEPTSQPLEVIATHPPPPLNSQYWQERDQQLLTVAQYVADRPHPVLVLGDLNITMWSPAYQALMRQTGLKNSRRGFGILPTWPTFLPLLSIPIDHCLLSPEFAVLKTGQGPNIGSDHVPLITELMLQTPRS